MEKNERYTPPECEVIHIRMETGILNMSGRDNEGELDGIWDDDE